jgi:uncharacterized membrane protein
MSGPSASSDTGIPSNVGAGLCAIFWLIGGIIFYFIEKKDQLVRHWAVQSIFFGGTLVAGGIVLKIAVLLLSAIPLLGPLLLFLLNLAFYLALFVLWIMGIIKAFQGTRWEYPVISEQCKKLFPKLVP